LSALAAVAAGLGGLAAAVGALAAGMRWIFRQGAAGQKLVDSLDRLAVRMDDNTQATAELAAAQKAATEKIDDALLDHERRLTRLEARA
jgi:uncharacterized protein (UPF0548 family)